MAALLQLPPGDDGTGVGVGVDMLDDADDAFVGVLPPAVDVEEQEEEAGVPLARVNALASFALK